MAMDDAQTVFAYPPSYSFDLDMSKRPLEMTGGPETKKARWSPNSFSNSPVVNSTRDLFANYGYGNHAAINQPQQQQNQQNAGYGTGSLGLGNSNGQLYSTPSLTVNTATGVNGSGMTSQISPSSATSPFPNMQSQNNGFGNYGMNGMLGMGMGMGMLGVNGFPYSPQMGSFQQNFGQQRMGNLNVPMTPTSGYSPVALNAALGSAGNATARTVYVGNLPSTASVDELLNLVHFGPLESIRVLPEKSCVFLSFLDGATAAAFHADATVKKLSLHGQELKIGWGKPSPVPSQVALSIQQSNASRNVYIGGLDENMTEEQLRDDLSRFGLIDQVKIVRDKNIGFVHFLSISTATKVVATLPTEPVWAGKRINYGKDRCAYIPKSQQAAAQAAQAAAAQSLVAQSAAQLSPLQTSPFSPYAPFSPEGANALGAASLNRTVYLGNIHPETTTEDLCNSIRGGVLQSIRYMQDKHIAFVTFIDPTAAFTFYQVASYQGLTLNNRRLKVGWGKNSGPLAPSLALAVHSGATRNVYIGNIEDFDKFNDEKLKRDFGEFGDIELVNFLKEKNCAFVNFTNISNAIKAIDGIKSKPDYTNLRIAHGKDRCANPPRSGPQGGSGGMRRSASGNTAASVASPLPDSNAAEFELDVQDAGYADADLAVGNAEMLVKDDIVAVN
ncbi:uncharacterized protein FOMMEDRAFT_138161 [Fomitiporia mediterranea MF3/22]|uniref:uncharacterized protein n=1 Tax=Fomitiporia mediterranea (strain MF3/22) TaxID=694068 RepID=UPI0004409A01|nr:uncharacterized protein FOMMEDRAFT_138161 [Fomitiporia mediterranea MF3/22]EJD08200.1 hypothetical protein FOMMEDRAFT_138161 [Fomitiporia mediterranea MF3/22]